MPKYKLLTLWGLEEPDLDYRQFDSYEDLLERARRYKFQYKGEHEFLYVRWEPGTKNSIWVGSFNSKELEGEDVDNHSDGSSGSP